MKLTTIWVSEAIYERDHDNILKLAKKSPYTKDFSNHIYSAPEMYKKGWIGIATRKDQLIGFVCVRHLVREPYTSLYFLGVDPDWKRSLIGTALVDWVTHETPHKEIRILVANNNLEAIKFWKSMGFKRFEKGEKTSKWRLKLS